MESIKITRDQAFHAMRTGEFGNEVTASKAKVAVVLTQDWCPQWHAMKSWIISTDIECDIYELVYNKEDYFSEFRNFKETKWRNGHIPYVRYYLNGKLVNESNYVSCDEFAGYFAEKNAG